MANNTNNATAQGPPLEDGEGVQVVATKPKHLGNDRRNAILQALLTRSSKTDDGTLKLNHGAKKEVARLFETTERTCYSIWTKSVQHREETGEEAMNVVNNRSNCGRKKKDISAALATMATIPFNQRQTLRSTAHSLGISVWQVYRCTTLKSRTKEVSSPLQAL